MNPKSAGERKRSGFLRIKSNCLGKCGSKRESKKNGDFDCEIDMSKIQKGNKDEQDIEA